MSLARRDVTALAAIATLGLIAWSAVQAWRSGQVGDEIARLAKPGDIQMVSSETCVFCTAARRWMTAQQVPFDECLVERDGACMARFQSQGAPGTPLIFVRGQPQLGFSPERVRDALR
jgi:glutaredoxin